MNFKGAIFDMDGTLVRSLGVWEIIWKRLGILYLNDENFLPAVEDDKAVRTKFTRDSMQLIHNKYHFASSGEELTKVATQIMKDYYTDGATLIEGAVEYLSYLKSHGVKTCIASATAKDLIKYALCRFEIDKYFDFIISCADIGKSKDKPDVFLKALEVLGTSIEDTVVFEDSLVSINTARAIGFRTVGVYDEHNFGQDRVKELSEEFVDKGESFTKLIKKQP